MLTNFVEYVIQHWFDRPAPTGTDMGESYIKASGGGESHNNMPHT